MDAPTSLTLDPDSLTENLPIGSLVGTLSTPGAEPNADLTYELVPGIGDTDNAAFAIDGNLLKSAEVFNFEAKSVLSIRVRVTDEKSATLERVFNEVFVTDENELPVVTTTPEPSASEDSLYTYQMEATDEDGSGNLTIWADALPSWLALIDYGNGTAKLSGTPGDGDLGEHSVILSVSDGANVIQQAFSLYVSNINDAPVLAVNQALNVVEGDKTSVTYNQLQATDADTPADQITFTITDSPDHGHLWEYFFANDDSIDNDGDGEIDEYDEAGSRVLQQGDTFDQTDIDNGRIEYRHTGVEKFEDEAQFLLTDGSASQTVRFAITIIPVNDAPTSIVQYGNTIAEYQPLNSLVGAFVTTDPDSFTFTYTLVDGVTDNESFHIVGNELRSSSALNFEAKSSYSIHVRSTDDKGKFAEQTFVINVTDWNEAPILDVTRLPEQFPSGEDERFPSGTPIYAYLPGTYDVDHGAQRGIAVLGAVGSEHGEWQFTLNGFTWKPLGNVSLSSARLLPVQGSQTRIRFVPAPDFNGTVSVHYAAWDQTQGTAGEVFDLSQPGAIGGDTAFSARSRKSPLMVLARNDAPKLDTSRNSTLLPIQEDNRNSYGTPVSTLLQGVSDVDARALKGVAITTASDGINGVWQYTLDGGTTWRALGTVNLSSARLLPTNGNLSRIRFVPNTNFHGTVQLGYFAWDQTQGAAGGTFNLSGPGKFGGTTAFSWAFETANLTVEPVSDEPRLTLPNAPVGYALNSPAVLLASTATVKAPDSANFAGGWLKAQIISGANAGGRLTLGGLFKVVDGNLIGNNTITMGIVQSGVGSTSLIIHLNANATLYRVEQLVRSIKFGTIGSSKAGQRTIAFSVSDGLNSSNVATIDVQVA